MATALRVTNTAVPSVLARYEFWLLFTMHLAVGCAYRFGYLHNHADEEPHLIDWSEMKVITAMTTFFEIFYTNHAYNRYLHFYEITRFMIGDLYDYCFELRLHLSPQCKQHARLATRQIVASVLLFFYEMDNVSEMEWDELVRQGLVKSQEREFLKKFKSQQHSLIMLQWSAEAAREGCEQCKAPGNVMKSLQARLVTCRSLQQEVIDTINMPMPFQYVHLMKLMLLVNLVCWAWGMGMTKSIFAPFVYWISLLIFMGMMELASQLADPFGDDDVDFPITEWLDEFVEHIVVLTEFRNPEEHVKKALEEEKALEWKAPGLQLFLGGEAGSVMTMANRLARCDDADSEASSLELSDRGRQEEEAQKPLMRF